MGVLPAVALCRHKTHDPSEINHEKKIFFQIFPWLIVDVAGEKHEFRRLSPTVKIYFTLADTFDWGCQVAAELWEDMN